MKKRQFKGKKSDGLKPYVETIKLLKSAILSSRYRAAVLANKEMLGLYFAVGKLISGKTQKEKWGAKVLEQISNDLQKELPGLRGFSASNIKRMRIFYDSWGNLVSIYESTNNPISSTASNQLQFTDGKGITISPTLSDQFKNHFFSISFSHHYEIIGKTKSIEERLFYITKVATEFWSLVSLKYHLTSRLYQKQGTLPNNFNKTISQDDLRTKALQSFKDEYLLDFINIEDPDEEDERMIENEIVRNIKKFLLSLGNDFAFIANQHRFNIDETEYFVDLLFFNRKLQCLVAFDLKKGKFKPDYLGQMNFYLSALDDMVKLPHEQASIGIVLCKEKNNKVVEFSFRDFNKPMGIATYKTANELPKKYKGLLPDANTLKKLME
jgi:predicted nuclease of restriction endonuclease-like (RecB) superfamily